MNKSVNTSHLIGSMDLTMMISCKTSKPYIWLHLQVCILKKS